jgi:hypothetical protein
MIGSFGSSMHGILFANEFMAPANQVVQEETSLDINDDEQLGGLMAQLVLASTNRPGTDT